MAGRDLAPHEWDELRDWCVDNPLAAAEAIQMLRDELDARDDADMWEGMFRT